MIWSLRSTLRTARHALTRALVGWPEIYLLAAARLGKPPEGCVFVDRTKDEIKNSPEFDENMYQDESYRTQLGSYYYDTDR